MERKRLFRSPDTQLVTLIVIATKLFFPFDKIRRQPESVNEPTTQVMDWTVWEQAQRHFENREAAAGHLEKGKELLTSENDVFSMTTTQMDEYLDWYENSWLISSKGITITPCYILLSILTSFSPQPTGRPVPHRSNGNRRTARTFFDRGT